MSERTFKVQDQLMRGTDVAAWQQFLYDAFRRRWSIEYPVDSDGIYGVATRSATASFLRAWGVESAADEMDDGVTPELRVRVRNNDRTQLEDDLAHSGERIAYRAALRDRFEQIDVCYPVSQLVTDENGWTGPNGHDGVDLICPWKLPLLAIVTSKVVRVSASGWWGNNPQPSRDHPISDGDGIVIIESTVDVGPFRKGMHFGYGHAEHALVEVDDEVKAGQPIAWAGWARAPHTHFMVNDDNPVDGLYRGVGDRDPMPFLDYARRNS
jgi:hypothetical protein